MKDTEKLRLHPTRSGGETGPMIGKFSSRDVLWIGLSLLVGLMVFILAGALTWSLIASIFAASSLPLATLGVLLALSNKPAGYALHWLEWRWIKGRGTGLFTHQCSGETSDDF